ncbi:AMP-binding protein [Sphingobium sp. V4]|uniref:AMP-binding protein n=1 Tax=Sphingobium sp. V4 TaxID=3038927 RepID=UPI002557F196|nr:AMP-binding protein [Sphingobium sp. V4]WIW89458.1 AMP-binding protein [Sphingobium sp. V4]
MAEPLGEDDVKALLDELKPWRIIPDRLRHWAKLKPDARFVQCESPWLTFKECDERSDRIAAGFGQLGIAKGDRVAVLLPNRVEMVLIFLALTKLGAIMVPLNIFLKGEFLAYQLRDSASRILVTDASGSRALADVAGGLPDLRAIVLLDEGNGQEGQESPVVADGVAVHAFATLSATAEPCPVVALTMHDIALIMYTSGTTGLPKGCMLSHGYYLSQPWSDIRAGMLRPDDVLYSAMPLFHAAAGVRQLGQALLVGAPTCFDAQFSARLFFSRVREVGATWVSMVAAMVKAVLALPPETDVTDHKVRYVTANAVRAEDQEQFEQRFGLVATTLGFGQTEGMAFTKAHLDHAARKRGTIGHAGYYFDIALLDDDGFPVPTGEIGELCVRPLEPEMMFSGYWGKPEKTLEAFAGLWYHTGDLASVDPDGFCLFQGRKTDSMRRRGENVSAVELEDAIGKFHSVHQVAVHAVPSPLGEDDIKACLILKADMDLDMAAFFDFLRRNVPYFAIPRFVEVMDAFPLTPTTGRVMKRLLRDRGVGDAIDLEAIGLMVDKSQRRS